MGIGNLKYVLKVNNNFTVKNWTHSTQHFNFIIADFEHVFFNLHQEFQKYVIPFQPSAGSHTKTSQLICSANQVTYLYKMQHYTEKGHTFFMSFS